MNSKKPLPSLMEATLAQTHHQVSVLSNHLSRIGFEQDKMVIQGDIEMEDAMYGEDDDEEKEERISDRPTFLSRDMVYTHELSCHDLSVLGSAFIPELSVQHLTLENQAVLGITGCRGPPGYATNTGATGPSGPNRFIDLKDCPSGYREGWYVVGTGTGIAFHEPPPVSIPLPLMEQDDGIWCFDLVPGDKFPFSIFLGGEKEVAFDVMVHYKAAAGPLTLTYIFLSCSDARGQVIMDMSSSSFTLQGKGLFQGVLTSPHGTCSLLHLSWKKRI